MASKRKEQLGEKRQLKTEESEEDSSSDESDSEGSASEESFDKDMEIPVEFEAFPPAKCDYHAMKNLLKQLFLKNPPNISELAELIISQENIGSIIKVVEDEETNEDKNENGPSASNDEEYEEEIFGLITVLDIVQYKDKSCIQQIKQLLLDKCTSCADTETQSRFKEILEGNKRVGLLFSERFINIPPQVALPLYKALRNELEEQHKKDKNSTLEYLLLLSKSYKEKQTKNSQRCPQKGKKSSKTDKINRELNFSNAEDEILHKEAFMTYSYPAELEDKESLLGGKWSFNDTLLEPYRTVMIIPYTRISNIIEQMETLLES